MRPARVVERVGVPAFGVVALGLLALMFFYPVAIVLVESIQVDGVRSLDPIAAILTDEFYFGVFAQALSDPGVFVREFPDYRLGLFGFTAYQALL